MAGKLVPVPINLDTVNRLYDLDLTRRRARRFFSDRAENITDVRTSEDVVVSRVGRDLYEKMFRGYTRKQWGLDPSQLDAQVTARIPVRTNRDDRYFTDTYQAMPLCGFTQMFENMLGPSKHHVWNWVVDYREVMKTLSYRRDGLHRSSGRVLRLPLRQALPYRSLEFRHETVNQDEFQPVAVVNYPNENAYTRITEFKHFTGQSHAKTSIVYEFPQAERRPLLSGASPGERRALPEI